MESVQGSAGSVLLERRRRGDSPRATEAGWQRPHALNLRTALIAVDAGAVTVAWWLVAVLGTIRADSLPDRVMEAGALILVAPVLTLALIATGKLYRARECAVRSVENARILRACVVAGAGTAVVAELTGLAWSAQYMVAGSLLSVIGLIAGRTIYSGWLSKRRRRGESRWPILIVGTNEEAGNLCRLAIEHPDHGFEVRGVVGSPAEAAANLPGVPWLGEVDGALPALHESGATGVLVATSAVPPIALNDVVRDMLAEGIHVRLSSGLHGIAQHRLRSAPMVHEPLFYVEQQQLTRWQLAVKRLIDVSLALVALVLAAPVMVAAAVAIKLTDLTGPVFFRQRRVGRNGRLFTLVKFRTMVVDAEARLAELQTANARSGPLFKMVDDPRVTPLGRILRATSIDELPQLFNVLAGRMSLVGPRPALPKEESQFSERLKARSQVLPGITGLWQVEARDNLSFWTYERLDLFYTENWSVGLDFGILLSTAFVVVDRGVEAVREMLFPSRERRPARAVLE